MEEVKSNSGQNLGIAALILGIITFVLAIIPCVGVIAIIPGIIAIILASVGMSQASRQNSPRGILIAGLIISVIAVMISFGWLFVTGKIIEKAHRSGKWPTEIQSVINDVRSDVLKELEDAKVSIKIESNGDSVIINANTSTKKKNQEKELEDLESGNKLKNDTVKKIK
jgi:phosphate/sulfate permease